MHAAKAKLTELERDGQITQLRDFVVTPDGGKPVRVVLATRADPEGGGDGGGMAAAEVPPFTERPYARAEDKEETIRMVHLSAADGTDVPPVAALSSRTTSPPCLSTRSSTRS